MVQAVLSNILEPMDFVQVSCIYIYVHYEWCLLVYACVICVDCTNDDTVYYQCTQHKWKYLCVKCCREVQTDGDTDEGSPYSQGIHLCSSNETITHILHNINIL